jgi:hypothetical protein
MKLSTLSGAITLTMASLLPSSGNTAPFPAASLIPQASADLTETVQYRRGGAARRGFVARGPRGGLVVGHRTAVVRPGYRPAYRPVPIRPGRPAWVRPPGYWWRPGAAVAAGAALGFVTAAAATAYVGQSPAPGSCWYYTNPQRTQGFWDVCPR